MVSSPRITPDRQTTDVVGDRIGAQIVDVVVMVVQVAVVGTALATVIGPDAIDSVEGVALLGTLTLPLYGGLLEGFWNGQTVGKRLFGIKVVTDRGTDPGVGRAVARNLPAVLLFGWLPTIVGLAAITTDDLRQRLFDSAADTYVVSKWHR